MRINTNVSAINAHRNLSLTQQAVGESMSKLSSGFRINRAADDAAGLAISNRLRADTRSLTQASRNVEQANAYLQIAEGGLSTVQKVLERMKELATQSASGNVTDALRTSSIKPEFDALVLEIGRIAGSTRYQGASVFTATATTFQVGTSADANDQIAVTIGALTAAGLGVAAGNLDTQATATTALGAIDTAITTLSTQLGTIGAYQNRLEYAQQNVKTAIQNFSAAESVIRDVDMAEEMTKFSKNNILAQAGTAMLAQANQSAQGVLQLLRG